MKCSFVELYQEKFYDLLDPDSQNLKLKMLEQDRFTVEGATEKEVVVSSDVFKVLF